MENIMLLGPLKSNFFISFEATTTTTFQVGFKILSGLISVEACYKELILIPENSFL